MLNLVNETEKTLLEEVSLDLEQPPEGFIQGVRSAAAAYVYISVYFPSFDYSRPLVCPTEDAGMKLGFDAFVAAFLAQVKK